MLTAERRNPNVVGGNWSPGPLEVRSKRGVGDGGLFIHFECALSREWIPSAIFRSAAGRVSAEFHIDIRPTQLRNGDLRGFAKDRFQCSITICDG